LKCFACFKEAGERLLAKQSSKTSPETIVKIIRNALILAVTILALNVIGFRLYDVLMGGREFFDLYSALLLEGLFMIACAVLLSRPYQSGGVRKPTIRFRARPVAAATVALAGCLLFIIGFLLASRAGL